MDEARRAEQAKMDWYNKMIEEERKYKPETIEPMKMPKPEQGGVSKFKDRFGNYMNDPYRVMREGILAGPTASKEMHRSLGGDTKQFKWLWG